MFKDIFCWSGEKNWKAGVVNLAAVLACVLRPTTKKSRQPPEKILATPMGAD